MSRKQRFLAWLGGVRGQLIVGVALAHAVMMTLFIRDLTERQQSLLLQRQTEQARTLAESLAVASAGWLASLDVFQPVHLGGRSIGWMRVGISQRISGDQLAKMGVSVLHNIGNAITAMSDARAKAGSP